jgi:hypothetical protein
MRYGIANSLPFSRMVTLHASMGKEKRYYDAREKTITLISLSAESGWEAI